MSVPKPGPGPSGQSAVDATQQHALWMDKLKEKRKLLDNASDKDKFTPCDYHEFMASFNILLHKYEKKPLAGPLRELGAKIGRFAVFTNAVNSISQVHMIGMLIWGGLQIIMVVALRYTNTLDGIVKSLATLSDTLSMFEHSSILYPENPKIHWPLRDMFSVFIDYCLKTTAYLLRPPALNWARGLLDSKPPKELKSLQESLKTHGQRFTNAVEEAHRETTSLAYRTALDIKLNRPSSSAPVTSFSKQPGTVVTERPLPNYKFIGREKELEAICRALERPNPSPQTEKGPACCIIEGLGGMGKTQIALKYSFLQESDYDAIFWLRSEKELELSTSYSQIAIKIRQRFPEDFPETLTTVVGDAMNIEIARDWLEKTNKRWLLIFDNVDNESLLAKFIPRTSTTCGAILITTQRHLERRSDRFHLLSLKSLSVSECEALLFRFLEREPIDDKESAQAGEVAGIVGCLPLAIATIGGAISHGYTLAEFAQELRTSDNIWNEHESKEVQGYDRKLGTVFEVAIGNLKDNSRKLLNVLAYLNPDSIPEQMLRGKHEDSELKFLDDTAAFNDAVRDLSVRQLAHREPIGPNAPFLSIHRTTQLCILHSMSSEPITRRRIFEQVFTIVRRQLPPPALHQGLQEGLFEKYKIYVPQLVSIHSHATWPEPRIKLSLDFAKVMIDIGTYMWRAGQFRACKVGLEEAEEILEGNGLDKNSHVLFSDIDDILGVICDREGCLSRDEALRRRNRALRIREASFADIPPKEVTRTDNIRHYNPHANLACTHIHAERFDEAEKLMELCYKNYKSWGSEDDFPDQYAKYYHHTSFGLMAKGQVDEALARVARSAELQLKHGGVTNLMYVAFKSRHGLLLYHAGKTADALKTLEEVREAYATLCGDANALTLDVTCFIAGILLETGQHRDIGLARKYLDHCLIPAHQVDWSEVGIAMGEFRLSKALTLQGEHKEARKYAVYAEKCRNEYIGKKPEYFKGIEHDEQAVHDQMISFWHYRMTGKLRQP